MYDTRNESKKKGKKEKKRKKVAPHQLSIEKDIQILGYSKQRRLLSQDQKESCSLHLDSNVRLTNYIILQWGYNLKTEGVILNYSAMLASMSAGVLPS